MLVDSHCHLNMIDYQTLNSDLDQILLEAKNAGVTHMLCVGTTLKDKEELLWLATNHSEVSLSIGLHPTEPIAQEPTIDELLLLSDHPCIVAIGETGLDYYRGRDTALLQQERFKRHISAAKIGKKPLIIHTRSANADLLAILREEKADQIGGVMHCFTEDWEMASASLDLGFYISISGIVTFKNAAQIQEVAKKVPLDRLLIETDSPYLAPVPHRGKINRPAYVRVVGEFIAQLRNESFEPSHIIRQRTSIDCLS